MEYRVVWECGKEEPEAQGIMVNVVSEKVLTCMHKLRSREAAGKCRLHPACSRKCLRECVSC